MASEFLTSEELSTHYAVLNLHALTRAREFK